MKTNYSTRYAASPQDVKTYDTARIREEFLIDNLMEKNVINLTYSHYDRFITGSAVPTNSILKLESKNRIIPIIRFVLDSKNETSENKIMIIDLLKNLYSYNNNLDEDSKMIQKSIQEIGLEETILKFSNLKI